MCVKKSGQVGTNVMYSRRLNSWGVAVTDGLNFNSMIYNHCICNMLGKQSEFEYTV